MGIFEKFKIGFKKSASTFTSGLREIIIKKEIDDKTLNEIEDFLIQSDVGVESAKELREKFANTKVNPKTSGKDEIYKIFSSYISEILKLNNIPCIRGVRYFGPSKMSIIGLVIHSFSIIAVFKYQVLIRSLAIYFFLLLFLNKAYITVVLLQSMLVIFTIIIFITSRRENSEAVSNSTNQIKDIINIHTT